MKRPKPKLAVLSGWGVSPLFLETQLADFDQLFDLQFLEIPDLKAGRSLSTKERSDELLSQIAPGSYLLGWSLGGAIAIDLAAYAPNTLAGVVTLATNPCFVAQSDWPGMDAQTFADFNEAYKSSPEKTLQRFASLQVTGADNPRAQLRQLKAALLPPQAPLDQLLQLLQVDRRASLRQLSCPVLALLGDADALVPVSLAEMLTNSLSAYPRLEVACIANSSHLLFQDQPQAVLQRIKAWLAAPGESS